MDLVPPILQRRKRGDRSRLGTLAPMLPSSPPPSTPCQKEKRDGGCIRQRKGVRLLWWFVPQWDRKEGVQKKGGKSSFFDKQGGKLERGGAFLPGIKHPRDHDAQKSFFDQFHSRKDQRIIPVLVAFEFKRMRDTDWMKLFKFEGRISPSTRSSFHHLSIIPTY